MSKQSLKPALFSITLNAEQGTNSAPEWLELVPAGKFKGRDGRVFNNGNAQAVINAVINRAVDIPIDQDHSTEICAPGGHPSPAVGRIRAQSDHFEIREGAVWGRVAWNATGRRLIENEAYFYYSPAFLLAHKDSFDITGLKSVGLTNTPNLSLTALNAEGIQPTEARPMNEVLKAVLAALGLAETATSDDAVAAINQLKNDRQTAMNAAQTPPLTQFVPRPDYDVALNRATTAEAALASRDQDAQNVAINAAVDAALASGQITPASRDFYVANCQQEGGLERFRAFVKVQPVVAPPSGLEGKNVEGTATALNAEEVAVAKSLGMTPDEFAAAKGAETA